MAPIVQVSVPPDGPAAARLVVVGEAPGQEEERHLRPFIGPSGKVLMEGLQAANLPREAARITNVCKWRPPESETPAQRFAGRWSDNIAELSSEVLGYEEARTLLLVGAEAAEAVLGICGPQKDPENPKRRLTPGVSEYHGSVFTRAEAIALQEWARGSGATVAAGLPPRVHSVVVTLHPAFTLRGKPRFKRWVKTVIGRAGRWSNKSAGPERREEARFNLMPMPEQVAELVEEARRSRLPLEVDVETPEEEQRRILLCGVGLQSGMTLVFPWGGDYAKVMGDWFAWPGVTLGHNFLYDLRAFSAYGIRPGPKHVIADTMVACARLHPVDDEVREFRWLSLGACMARHLDGRVYHKKPQRGCQRAIYGAHYPGAVGGGLLDRIYCGRDCEETGRLWEPVRDELKRESML